MAQAITDLSMRESVYRAALAVGAKVIQPSLVDFIG
jgi:flagellar hook-associated protein 3 FlgL